CPMRLDPVKECNHADCIRCGKCISDCPAKALSFTPDLKRSAQKSYQSQKD
ncbi:MAG: 4Fe-4S binding protein, partial [Lachnospiraceae bacterium]|nr:4Fe-4S binding protein [Lachnospiraceae bacterium]